MCTWVLVQSLWTDIPIMPLPLIKSTKSYSVLFPSQNYEKEKWYQITGWEHGIRPSCLIPPVGNCIHSCISEYLFCPISFKSRWKSRPSDSNSIVKQNSDYYYFNGSLCFKLLDMDQTPNSWSPQKIVVNRLLERCRIQKNTKCWDLISKGITFTWYAGNKCA